MSREQSGILPEHCRAAIWLEAKLTGDCAALSHGIKNFITELERLQRDFTAAHLGAVVAFGSSLWRDLSAGQGATELKDFVPLGNGLAPATQRDVLIHIQSLRHDVNFSAAQAAMAALGKVLTIVEEVHGFRWIEERDLSGFVDGTENPAGETLRREVAIINGGIDAGGSYVMTQRWEHNLTQLNRMSISAQENLVGRTKQANEEMDSATRPATSHLTRVDLKENGQSLKIVRQSLPYGTVSGKHGLYFISYCARLHNIEQQLLSMFGETDGKLDGILRFTQPVTGSYFFAPSLDRLLAL